MDAGQIDGPVRVLAEDLVLVDWGPMTLTVSAWRGGTPRPVMAARAARAALQALTDLAEFQTLLKTNPEKIKAPQSLPRVVARALDAVRSISPELTPLAAVAGAAADQVADMAVDLGADRVIVNNGGDIAIRLKEGTGAVVGIKPPEAESLVGRLSLNSVQGVGGVATSGWSGRSFSPGVADIVCVWAGSSAIADAAATFVAGRCDAAGKAVEKAPADELDPSTDLGSRLVTVKVGELSAEEKRTALKSGQTTAERLLKAGLIKGCLMEVQGERLALDQLEAFVWDN